MAVDATNLTSGRSLEIDPEELHFQQLKVSIHEQLVDELELSLMAQIDPAAMADRVRAVAADIVKERKRELNGIDRDRLLTELDYEVFGFGPLEPLLSDPEVDDVLVNNPYEIYIERKGLLQPTDVMFADEAPRRANHIQRIAGRGSVAGSMKSARWSTLDFRTVHGSMLSSDHWRSTVP